MKPNLYLAKSAMAGALGGLLFGFDTAVIAGATYSLTATFHLTPSQLGLTVSIALWGSVLGALTSGLLGERLGGRRALMVMAALYLVSAIGCASAWNWSSLLVLRFIGGLGIGGSSVLGPVYIAEIAPATWRGRLVGTFQINVVVGILLAYLSNFCVALFHLGNLEWRWQLGIPAAPALLFLVLVLGIPQSPRWLATKGRLGEALDVLRLVGSSDAETELQEIVGSIQLDRSHSREPLFSRKYAFPIFLAIAMGMFNQLSGINAILYYLNDIFSSAGFSHMSSSGQAVVIGFTNLVATLIAMAVIDHIGRKKLLLIGSAGMVFCLGGVAHLFWRHEQSAALLGLLVGFIIFFAISQGAVIWVYISEIFPNKVRSRGQSVGSSAHWITNAIIAGVFPLVAARSNALPFVAFAAMMALQFVLVLLIWPETKGATLEQIQVRLGIDRPLDSAERMQNR
jgi:SP family arabinose:H+ symporter-like MFS transporter